jgi:lipoic acid synthetase
MLGLGETHEEIEESLHLLRGAGVDFLTLGQYLRPSENHAPVKEYVEPARFERYRELGESLGFRYVASGPLVRSSYKAGEFFFEKMVRERRTGDDRR